MAAASPSEWLQQLSQPAVLSCQPANKSLFGILRCSEGRAVNSDEKRKGKKKVSTWIRSSFMCHFHLVSFVAVTKLFLLIPSGSQAQLWWKLQSFTWGIMGIASIECRAGKGTGQSSMEHQWLQAEGCCCSTGNQGGKLQYPFLQDGCALEDGGTGPCCKWRILFSYNHSRTLDPSEDYGFGFICSHLLRKML